MSRPKEADKKVLIRISGTASSIAPLLPPLNPNHPNQRIEAPKTTKGTLFGCNPGLALFPTSNAAATAAAPALMCITVPPAKSNAPASPIHPPPHTQCATGE